MFDPIEFVKVRDDAGNLVERLVFAYRVYDLLEVEGAYKDWMNWLMDYGFEEGADFFLTYPDPEVDDYEPDEDDTDHLMTLDMAKTVCTLHGTENARELRRFLIESEKRGDEPRFDDRELSRDDLFLLSAGLHAEKVELEAEVEKLQRVNHELRDLINRMLGRGL